MKTFFTLVLSALVIYQCHGLTCYNCFDLGVPDYPSQDETCGDPHYNGTTTDLEGDDVLCFVAIYPQGIIVRGLSQLTGKHDGQCENVSIHGEDSIAINCYCAQDKCNIGACDYCK
ncbi:unnamed protein product [Meganyctiphanes norvegica]|uniref:Uncharacterized protein n=1 Tax=Meganyctiphanes norvegica TaxID=48144 RepID=A0AAV2RCE6_MEGNR